MSTGRGCEGGAKLGRCLLCAAERGGGGDGGVVDYFTDLLKSGDNLAKVTRAGALEDD